MHPWLCITISAAHMIDDMIFVTAYYLLWQRGMKNLFAILIGLYVLGFLVAVSSLVMIGITVSRGASTKSAFLNVGFHMHRLCTVSQL